MDADTVKQVEFSRKMRGYDMGQVDAFLEDLEATLRRQSLERESMQHRLDELSGARDAQSEKLSILNGQLLLTKEENQHLTERVAQLEKELEEKNARIAELEKENVRAVQERAKQAESLPKPPAVLPPWEEPVEENRFSLENLHKHLHGVGNAAKDSFLQVSKNLKNRKNK